MKWLAIKWMSAEITCCLLSPHRKLPLSGIRRPRTRPLPLNSWLHNLPKDTFHGQSDVWNLPGHISLSHLLSMPSVLARTLHQLTKDWLTEWATSSAKQWISGWVNVQQPYAGSHAKLRARIIYIIHLAYKLTQKLQNTDIQLHLQLCTSMQKTPNCNFCIYFASNTCKLTPLIKSADPETGLSPRPPLLK